MPPRAKKTEKKPQKLKQTTLLGAIQSPSQKGPKTRSKASTSKVTSPPKRKRTVVHVHSSDEDEALDSDTADMKLSPKKPDADDDEDDAPPLRSPKRRKTTRAVESDEDDDAQIPPRRTSRSSSRKAITARPPVKPSRKGKEKEIILTDDSMSEGLVQPRRRRKLVKGVRPQSSPMGSDEDVNVSSDEVEKERIIENRFRTRGKQSVFQKNLEKLKRKKQGKPIESSNSENDSDEDDESEGEDRLFDGAKLDGDHDSLFDEDSDQSETIDSDNFIVDDDGAPAAQLPVEFSMDTHQDLAHQFKKVFQFFVHIAVRPAVERHEFMEQQMKNEEYFRTPLVIARRKISGLRDSLVASSVWRPDFKKPMDAYPELDLIHLDFAVPKCDACHLGRRMATLTARLHGRPYDRLGFEDESDDEGGDSSDSDVSSKPERPETVEFVLGRFCARRTKVYHTFTHWEYSLFKTIIQEVDELHEAEQAGKLKKFVRVSYAGGKKPPEDLQDADGICEWLEDRKFVEVEWQKVKEMMESARHLEMASKRGEDD